MSIDFMYLTKIYLTLVMYSINVGYMAIAVHTIIWERKIDRYFMGKRVPVILQKIRSQDGQSHLVEIYEDDMDRCPDMKDPYPFDRYLDLDVR
jgi:hypothetical protein